MGEYEGKRTDILRFFTIERRGLSGVGWVWYTWDEDVQKVVVAENQRSIKDLKGDADMCEALREIMKDEIEEAAQGGMEKGMEKGLEKGMEKGMETAQRNIALEMLRQEMADEKILQITKLSKEILEELKKEL